MLVFIIPLKSQKISKSWQLQSKLVERCVKSICNQTSSDFRAIVVCHEKPNFTFERPELEYLQVDFPPPDLNVEERQELASYAYGWSEKIVRQNADKAKKVRAGLNYAEKYQPSHFMVVDADDCVNRYIAQFVSDRRDEDGWILKKGYAHKEGSKFLFTNLKTFNQLCGTSLILKYSLRDLVFSNPEFYNHCFTELEGANLQPLPFVGAMYSMENGDNIYMDSQTKSEIKGEILKRGLKFLVDKISKYRFSLMTNSVVKDFGAFDILPNVN
jgi:hypothetical protein